MKVPQPVRAKAGDVLEYAIWLDGTETREARTTFEEACRLAVKRAEDEAGVITGPLVFTEKRPGDDRVPKVPDHIHGPDVRLLVVEAPVLGPRRVIVQASFLNELEPRDLERLRRITKRAHAKSNPGAALTDEQADAVIERLGPEAALDALRRESLH